jgi:hypothetical protein
VQHCQSAGRLGWRILQQFNMHHYRPIPKADFASRPNWRVCCKNGQTLALRGSGSTILFPPPPPFLFAIWRSSTPCQAEGDDIFSSCRIFRAKGDDLVVVFEPTLLRGVAKVTHAARCGSPQREHERHYRLQNHTASAGIICYTRCGSIIEKGIPVQPLRSEVFNICCR